MTKTVLLYLLAAVLVLLGITGLLANDLWFGLLLILGGAMTGRAAHRRTVQAVP